MNPFFGKTYAEAIDLLVETYGDREALVFGEARYSFRQVAQEIETASRKFAALGLSKGDKVAIWSPNRPEFLFAWLGASRIGLVAVIMNTRLRKEEAAYQLRQSDSRAVVVPGDGAFRDFLADIAALAPAVRSASPGEPLGGDDFPEMRFVISFDPTSHDFKAVTQWDAIAVDTTNDPPVETDVDATALIAYSSGTTALPKGAMLTHVIWRKAADHGARFFQTPEDKLYLCVPLFSILSTVNGVITYWVGGSCVVLDERYEPEKMLSTIEKERCTSAYLLPLMITRAVELPNFEDYDISSLRTGILVTTDPDAYRLAYDKLGMKEMITSYGMTETSSACTRTWASDPLEVRLQTHGKPLPDIEVRVADPVTNAPLPAGVIGEIQVRGYNVMAGYYNKPEETKRAFAADGWYKTGDAGEMLPDGAFRFLRRLSEGYKCKGFNVSSAEVEAALLRHPDIGKAAVFGIPDKEFGEVGIAFVIPKDGRAPTPASVIAFAREHLASFKVPAHVFAVDDFPMTAGTEKVQKFKLREQALRSLGRAS